MIRKHSFNGLEMIIAVALLLVAPQTALSMTILSPTQGAIVRENVRIAVPRSEVPDGGFISVSINGRFHGAAVAPASGDADAVYVWNSKAPFPYPDLPEQERLVSDGRYEIEVAVHDHRGIQIKTETVSVRVSNQIAQTTPPEPLSLYYRYRIGDVTRYRVTIRGELLDSTGLDLLGGRPAFTSEYEMAQWIEDVRPDGSALVRYRLADPPRVTMMGQPVTRDVAEGLIAPPSSIYKIVDRYGRIVDPSVFRRGAPLAISDVMVPLPPGQASIGQTWQAPRGVKVEGLADLIRLTGSYELESLEYEGGRACAKISGKLAGSNIMLDFLPGQFRTDARAAVTGNTNVFFDYNVGKVVRSDLVMDIAATVDASSIGSLAVAGMGTFSGPIMRQFDDEADFQEMVQPHIGGTRPGGSYYNPYGPGATGMYGGQQGYGQEAAARARVTLRITASMGVATGT